MCCSLFHRALQAFPLQTFRPIHTGILQAFCPILCGTARPLTGSVLALFGGWRPVIPSLYCFPGRCCPFVYYYGRMWPSFCGCHDPIWPPFWLPHRLLPAFVCVCHVILASIIYWRKQRLSLLFLGVSRPSWRVGGFPFSLRLVLASTGATTAFKVRSYQAGIPALHRQRLTSTNA